MVWKKLKKLIIPFFIIKALIFVIFISRGDLINISEDSNQHSNYIETIENDSIALKEHNAIHIVRNEKDTRFSLRLRGKKDTKNLLQKETEIPVPIID